MGGDEKLGFFASLGLGKAKRLKEKRDLRKEERTKAFAALEEKFTRDTVDASIVDLPYDELIKKLQSRELKAVQVLSAYIWKALEVTKRCNCVTEFHPMMMEWALELDALPEPKGPLHGLPFCVKDDTDLEGMDTTCGCSALLEDPKEKSAVFVQVIKDAGAIPFCKANLCQGVVSYACENPIYGKTCNPWDEKRSPGGSSGGTGCLVAAGGAVFGTGSDIGGSLRIPAHFCGTCTLLPTQFRNSVRGLRQIQPDESAGLHGQIGIIANNANFLADLYKLMWKDCIQSGYDAAVIPVPWNSGSYESKKSLKIGYFTSLPFMPAVGDTPEIVIKAKERLEALGHVLVEFEMPDNWELLKVFITLAMADGLIHGYRAVEHDEICSPAEKFVHKPNLISKLGSTILGLTKGKTTRDVPPDPNAGSSDVLWDYLKKQRQLRNDLLDHMKAVNVDVLLSPTFPFPACSIDKCEDLFAGIVYTCVWNLMGFPAGVVPFGTETGQLISSYDDQGDAALRAVKEDMTADVAGLPIGVQLIGKPFRDEIVLRLMCELFPSSSFSPVAKQN